MSELLIMAAFFHVILYTLCNVITSSNFPPRTDATTIIPSLILIGISIVCMRRRSVNKSVWEGFSLCEKPCKLTILLLGSSFHEWVVRIMNVQWYSLFLYVFFVFVFVFQGPLMKKPMKKSCCCCCFFTSYLTVCLLWFLFARRKPQINSITWIVL